MTEYDHGGYPIAERPHLDAVFDPMWRSRHGAAVLDGWRFEYRCAHGCPDAIGSMPAGRPLDQIPDKCPDCSGPVALITAADRGQLGG